MKKHKRFLVLGLLSILLLVAYGFYLYINNGLYLPKGIVIRDKAEQQIIDDIPIPAISNFDLIKEELNKKNYAQAAIFAEDYGNEESNYQALRISAFGYCAYASSQRNDEEKASECKKKGEELIYSLSDQAEKDFSSAVFEANTRGETYKDTTVIPEDKIHE